MMDEINDKFIAHLARWDIQSDDDRAFREFKTRLKTGLNSVMFFVHLTDEMRIARVLSHLWALPLTHDDVVRHDHGRGLPKRLFDQKFHEAKTQRDLSVVLQGLAVALEASASEPNKRALRTLVKIVRSCTSLTPTSGFEIAEAEDGIAFYPPGARLLDQNVVNSSIAWLSHVPEAQRAFSRALRMYLSGEKSETREVLDNLRFALEQLLKHVLENDKSFENQKEQLLAWLSDHGVHNETVKMVSTVLYGPYKRFMNDAVKHASDYSHLEVEFMIYLSATIMRLVLVVESDEPP